MAHSAIQLQIFSFCYLYVNNSGFCNNFRDILLMDLIFFLVIAVFMKCPKVSKKTLNWCICSTYMYK